MNPEQKHILHYTKFKYPVHQNRSLAGIMNLVVFFVALAFYSGAHAATRVLRATQQGWGASIPGTAIAEEGASTAAGVAGALAEHSNQISVQGGWEVPAIGIFSDGSNTGLSNDAYNYQQSAINNDGSSQANQANLAGNSGFASDYLWGEAQGVSVDVNSQGWSAVEGEGAVGQVDTLEHVGGPAATGGWCAEIPAIKQ